MPEGYENDPNYLGKQAIAISPAEVEMMYGSCEAAVSMAHHGMEQAAEENDAMAVIAFTALEFGLKHCVKYFQKMKDCIDGLKEARQENEPDLNELKDEDRN